MNQELLLIGVAWMLLLVPYMARRSGQKAPSIGLRLLLFCGFTLTLVGCFSSSTPEVVPVAVERDIKTRPVELPDDGYVGSAACQKCHVREHASWDDSFHQSMTQLPTSTTVLGDFTQSLRLDGVQYELAVDDEGYWVSANLGNGPVRLKIQLLTGSHHMQLYWFGIPEDIPPLGPKKLLGLFPFVYLIAEQQWLPRRSAFITPPGSGESFEIGRWNASCIRCHSTHPKARYHQTANPDSSVTEFGISCEACHGPGQQHVRLHEVTVTASSKNAAPSESPDRDVVNPLTLDHQRASQICGNCHSATSVSHPRDAADWHANGNQFRPGDQLLDHRHLIRASRPDESMTQTLLDSEPDLFDSLFWSDSMVRVTGREYSALVESRCHTEGEMSCLSCHTMHNLASDKTLADHWNDDQLKPQMHSNQACVKCHSKYQGEALTRHTHHLSESEGSRCYNCHMPHSSYGLLKAVRSHQISSPHVGETLDVGRQNACNQCHLDKTLQWTAQSLNQWYDHSVPELPEVHQKISTALIHLLTGDAGQRALAAWSLSWDPAVEASGGDWQGEVLTYLLEDPYDAVGVIAMKSLKRLHEDFHFDLKNYSGQRVAISKKLRSVPEAKRVDPELLRKPDGQLDTFVLEFLLKQRDNRSMYLQE
ncbi:MAG: multiheme c-type cytochrome [Planctomycetota bacterium]|nr:multiheme c-type cytochrome [Planctomycetota bacterium]